MRKSLCLIAALALLFGCHSKKAVAPKPLVVVAIPPLAFIVSKIAGDLVDVAVMIPAGADHELYEPKLSEMKDLARASLLVKVGHPNFMFEKHWLPQMQADNPQLRAVDCSLDLPMTGDDPHIWLTPANVKVMSQRIHQVLVELLPRHRATLDDRLKIFLTETQAVDEQIRQTLANLKHTKFFVFHPAWGYFAKTYGLEQIAIEQNGKEPDPKTLAWLLELAKTENTKSIFVQPKSEEKAARWMAKELHAETVVLDPLEYNWLENLRHTAMLIGKSLRN